MIPGGQGGGYQCRTGVEKACKYKIIFTFMHTCLGNNY